MNKDDVDEFLAKLISLLNGIINLDTFKEILIPNYTDIEGNSYFHFLTEYSFEEFCLRNMKLSKDQKPITMEQYNSLKNEYIQQINFCIKTLLELNCDLFFVNGKNQSPLLFSINNNNYLVSLEYLKVLQNIGIYTKEDYYDFLDTILKKGNCFNKDCIELINLILSNIDSIVVIIPSNTLSFPQNKILIIFFLLLYIFPYFNIIFLTSYNHLIIDLIS